MWRSWKTGRLLIVAAMLCTLAAGCTSVQTSGIDPSGEHVFVPPPPPANYNPANERYFDDPMGRLPWDDVAVQLRPQEMVAPVGSEVVLIAGVCGPDGYLRTNRRLEWTIAPGSVGHFVAVEKGRHGRSPAGRFQLAAEDRRHLRHRQHLAEQRPAEPRRLPAGKQRARAPRRGLDHAHLAGRGHEQRHRAVAPEVYQWNARLKSAMVHWVDALVHVSAAGDQSGRHAARLHHHGDAALEPVALRGLAGAV